MRGNKDYHLAVVFFCPVPLTMFLNLTFWIIGIYLRDGESVFVQSRTEILLLLALDRIEWGKL